MGSYPSAIVGLGHRNSSGQVRGAVAYKVLSQGCEVDLKWEPHNPHDRNAVAVWFGGHDLGYLPARHASWVSERLADDRFMRAFVDSIEATGLIRREAERVELNLITTPSDLPGAVYEDEYAEAVAKRDAEHLARKIWPFLQAGTAILKHLAEVGGTDPDKSASIVDDFLLAHLTDLRVEADKALLDNLRARIAQQKGSRRAALLAAGNFGSSEASKTIFVDHARKMIMSDGQITAAEMRALKAITDKIVTSQPET